MGDEPRVVILTGEAGWQALLALPDTVRGLRGRFGPHGVVLGAEASWLELAKARLQGAGMLPQLPLWQRVVPQLLATLQTPSAVNLASLGHLLQWPEEAALQRHLWRGPLGPARFEVWQRELVRRRDAWAEPRGLAAEVRAAGERVVGALAALADDALQGAAWLKAMQKVLAEWGCAVAWPDGVWAEFPAEGLPLAARCRTLEALLGRHGGAVHGEVRLAVGGMGEADQHLMDHGWVVVWTGAGDEPPLPAAAHRVEQAGAWPVRQAPTTWSPSLLETLAACPYKAWGQRMLRLEAWPDVGDIPDGRMAGNALHEWLANVGKAALEGTFVGLPGVLLTERLVALAQPVLATLPPVVAQVLRARIPPLAKQVAGELLTQHAAGQRVQAVEQKVVAALPKAPVRVEIAARLDRVDADAAGRLTVVDYKSGDLPSWSKVASGEKPQLAIEAWLLQQAGAAVQGMALWGVKGYGSKAFVVNEEAVTAELLTATEAGMTTLVGHFLPDIDGVGDAVTWPALPGRKEGVWQASGPCEHCDLAGVCRAHGHVAVGAGL
jgi:RecB family exonuclease